MQEKKKKNCELCYAEIERERIVDGFLVCKECYDSYL